ncbi:MAG: transposase, partial [Clostridia bacterium]|nr:transposase [Clostridia bacterium]
GLAPAVTNDSVKWYFGGYGIKTKTVGQIAEKMFADIEKRFAFVTVDSYVIMPNHIHLIVVLHHLKETAGASPRPTLHDIICAYKSLVTRCRNKMLEQSETRIFQASYYEHIIRNDREYANIMRYIFENPIRWNLDGEEPF